LRVFILCIMGLLGLWTPVAAGGDEPKSLAFQDGDRIVLVGDTLIERDQRHGYLETILTISNPDKNLTFRNLGWSGDTVAGLSRAGFDPPSAGYKQLVAQILAAKPTVLIVGYGMSDSFDGEAGRPRFVEGLNRLLDAVARTNARLVLLSPIAHANLGSPWPDPAPHNLDLERYTRSIEEVARNRDALFIDLFKPTREQYGVASISDNGIHLNEIGYRFLAAQIVLGLDPHSARRAPQVELIADGRFRSRGGVQVDHVEPSETGVRFRVTRQELPIVGDPTTDRLLPTQLSIKVRALPAGEYELKEDGHRLEVKPASEWAKGVSIATGPDFDQSRELRCTINRKNTLFFDRWRPQNITYLFGFRKHEQGKNAVEIPRFDPLVAEKEQEIARLRQPIPHRYELVRVESEVVR
jgi:lysophospholipase L1-like esterase